MVAIGDLKTGALHTLLVGLCAVVAHFLAAAVVPVTALIASHAGPLLGPLVGLAVTPALTGLLSAGIHALAGLLGATDAEVGG